MSGGEGGGLPGVLLQSGLVDVTAGQQLLPAQLRPLTIIIITIYIYYRIRIIYYIISYMKYD